jgi:hypothetical protein
MPEAMDSLLATPTISTRLPLRKPMGVVPLPVYKDWQAVESCLRCHHCVKNRRKMLNYGA